MTLDIVWLYISAFISKCCMCDYIAYCMQQCFMCVSILKEKFLIVLESYINWRDNVVEIYVCELMIKMFNFFIPFHRGQMGYRCPAAGKR